MNITKFEKSKFRDDIEGAVRACESLRSNEEMLADIDFSEYVNKRWAITLESFLDDLGINTSTDTIQNMFTLPDSSVRWLIPEIIRSALRLGLRKNPIWPDIIAAEQTIKNPTVTIPHFNMSDAAPKYVGQLETIPLGDISFGQKTLKVRKIGRGIKIPYEVRQYVVIDVVSIFLQDFGVKLNQAIDTLMVDVLINGEQANGSESAPVVGVGTAATLAYRDLLKVWIRMSRIGKEATAMIGGEEMAIDTLNLTEFKTPVFGTPMKELDLRTPVPQKASFFVHGAVPTDQVIIIDRSASIIKYNAQPLLIESEKIISNQAEATYASLTTGFGIVYRDGRVLLDRSLAFASGNGFPAYMNPSVIEQVEIEE